MSTPWSTSWLSGHLLKRLQRLRRALVDRDAETAAAAEGGPRGACSGGCGSAHGAPRSAAWGAGGYGCCRHCAQPNCLGWSAASANTSFRRSDTLPGIYSTPVRAPHAAQGGLGTGPFGASGLFFIKQIGKQGCPVTRCISAPQGGHTWACCLASVPCLLPSLLLGLTLSGGRS